MIESDDYKRGWYDGYQAAQRQNPTITQPPITMPEFKPNSRCIGCGMDLKYITHYVCNSAGCPSRVSCSTGETTFKIMEPWLK